MIFPCILLVMASIQYLVFYGFIAVTFFIVHNKHLCSSFWYLYFHSINKYYQH